MTDRPNRVVHELRVHGVSGTPPESMLGEPFPRQVAGDDTARFFRAAEPVTTLPGGTQPPRSRIVEAFHWGRFTSGGASRALWLLLAPFALLNLSRYMLLGRGKFADGVLRLLGVVLTSVLVANTVHLCLELVVRQCSSSAVCLQDNGWLDFTATWPFGARLLLGVVPTAAVIGLLWWFGRQTFLYEPKGERHEWVPEDGSLRDHAFWHTSPRAPALRAAHVAVACAVTGILYSGALNTDVLTATAPTWLWAIAVGVGVLLVLLAALGVAKVPATESRPDPRFNDSCRVPLRFTLLKWGSLVYLAGSVVLAAVVLWDVGDADALARPLAGFEVVTMVQSGLAAVLLLVLLGVCRKQRGALDPIPEHARTAFGPMWGGFAAWITAAFATTLAAGFSSGFAYRVADLLGEPVGDHVTRADVAETAGDVVQWRIELSEAYWTGVVLWGVLAVVFLVLLLPLLAVMAQQPVAAAVLLAATISGPSAFVGRDRPLWWLLGVSVVLLAVGLWLGFGRWRSDGLDDRAAGDYEGEHDDGVEVTRRVADEPQPRGIGKVATAWRLARAKYRYHWALGTISVLGGALVVAAGVVGTVRLVVDREATDPPAWLLDGPLPSVGGWVLSGLAAGLVLLGIRSWQGQKMRTVVGVLWDLIAFWPRYAHPICPPPYGGRATLELASRANHLANQPGEHKVVLSGHSQGSVVCVAAVLVLAKERETDDSGHCYIKRAEAENTVRRLGLVTYGSQLRWAFARLFPRYLGYAELASVHEVLGGRWRNVHRWTDPLGGPVLTWQDGSTQTSETSPPTWHAMGSENPPGLGEVRAGGEGSFLRGRELGHDIRLRDPEFIESLADRPRSRLRGHSGYYDDPVFDEVVADVADEEPARDDQPRGPTPLLPPTYADEGSS
ncbi:hypothetical protein [Umezawaea sp.]|uniref:hypothetical protein n=1 Tax=Umezawaea sp. TaxID=1955258 RepID=UPI002ECFF095